MRRIAAQHPIIQSKRFDYGFLITWISKMGRRRPSEQINVASSHSHSKCEIRCFHLYSVFPHAALISLSPSSRQFVQFQHSPIDISICFSPPWHKHAVHQHSKASSKQRVQLSNLPLEEKIPHLQQPHRHSNAHKSTTRRARTCSGAVPTSTHCFEDL